MKTSLGLAILALLISSGVLPAAFAQEKSDNDHTLQAMRDEMGRAKDRLELKWQEPRAGRIRSRQATLASRIPDLGQTPRAPGR